METARYNLKVQKWILILSVVLFSIKITAYYVTNSLAILSDALESIVNVLAGIIGYYSLYIAAKPKDEDHPYGHGKAEFVSAAIEGGLVVAAGMLIIYETIRTIIDHNPVKGLDWGLITVGSTAVVNFIAGTYCVKVGKKNNSLALQATGKHLQTDTLSTLAVIAGLIIIIFTNWVWIDKIIAILLGIYIIFQGYKIVRQSIAGIMDEQDMDLLKQLVTVLNENRRVNWVDLHNLRIIKYGSQLHIDCHLTVPWYLNVNEAHFEIDELTNLIKEKFGTSIEFFVHTDGCRPFSCSICNKKDCSVRQHSFEKTIEWTFSNVSSNKKHRL